MSYRKQDDDLSPKARSSTPRGETAYTPSSALYDDKIGKNLENYLRKKEILDAQKARSQQEAAITYDRLLKYLPEQLRREGLSGNVKASETAQIDAANRYANGMSAIGFDYAKEAAALAAARDEREDAIRTQWRAEEKTDEQNAYSSAREMIASGAFKDADDLDKYLGSVAGKVTDAHYAELAQLGSAKLYSREEEQRSRAFDSAKELIASGVYDEDELENYLTGVRGRVSEEQYSILKDLASVAGSSEKQQKQYNVYTTVMAQIEGLETTQDRRDYLERYKDRMSAEQYADVEAYIDAIAQSSGQKEYENEVSEQRRLNALEPITGLFKFKNNASGNFEEGDAFDITDENGNVYDVKSEGAVDDEMILRKARSLSPDYTVFVFDNNLYIKRGNEVFKIARRSSNDWDAIYRLIARRGNDVTSLDQYMPEYIDNTENAGKNWY